MKTIEMIAVDSYNRQRAYLMLAPYRRKNNVTGRMEQRYRVLDIEGADFGTMSHNLGFLGLPIGTSNGIINYEHGMVWKIK